MDFKGVYEREATGWQLGLYQDVKQTLRADVVVAIFRVPMAVNPAFIRYAWGQIKPIFETEAFGEFAAEFRDAILSPIEDSFDLPIFHPSDLEMKPADYRELQGQTATYEIIAPRLPVIIELFHRGLQEKPIGHRPDERMAATNPLTDTGDRNRGLSPTLLTVEEVPNELTDVVSKLRDYHGFPEDSLATVHLTHAQWPSFLSAAWDALHPVLESDAFAQSIKRADNTISSFVNSLPYRPRLQPVDLRRLGFSDNEITELQSIITPFRDGPPWTVIRTLPIYGVMAGVGGRRSTLTSGTEY